jgi:hypothetical protein
LAGVQQPVQALEVLRAIEIRISKIIFSGGVSAFRFLGKQVVRTQQIEHDQGPVGVKLTHFQLALAAVEAGFGGKLARTGRGKIPETRRVRAFVHLELLDRFRNDEVKIGVALAVGVAHHIHGQPIDAHRKVGAVVGIEAAHEYLLGLATARVLRNKEARHQPQQVLRRVDRPQRLVDVRDSGQRLIRVAGLAHCHFGQAEAGGASTRERPRVSPTTTVTELVFSL